MTALDLPPGLRIGGHPEPDGGQPMTDVEVRMVREALGLTQDELAAWLDVDPRTVRRWEAGKSRVPEPVREELESMEQETEEWVGRLVSLLGDAADVVLTIPRDGRPPFTGGWWRAVAYRVAGEVPGLYVRYDEGAGG